MYKLNSFSKECFDPHKIVWNCKKHSSDTEWIYLCGICIKYFKYVNGNNFESQFQNIKSLIRCRLDTSKMELPLYEV